MFTSLWIQTTPGKKVEEEDPKKRKKKIKKKKIEVNKDNIEELIKKRKPHEFKKLVLNNSKLIWL